MCKAPQFAQQALHMQLSLIDFASWRDGDATAQLIDCMREVVAIRGLKAVSAALGVNDTVLSHALSGNGRHPVRLEWLEWFARNAPSDRIPQIVAGLRGLDCIEREVLTPEEELARLKAAMAETVGPEVQRIIAEKVRTRR